MGINTLKKISTLTNYHDVRLHYKQENLTFAQKKWLF